MSEKNDPLFDPLREEAMAERPVFSPELHQKVLRHVHAQRPRAIGYWRMAAAIGFVAALAGGYFVIRSNREHPPISNVSLAKNVREVQHDPEVSFGGIFVARLWPPQIGVGLPLASLPPVSALQTPQISPSPNAATELDDWVPPDIRFLVGLAEHNYERMSRSPHT